MNDYDDDGDDNGDNDDYDAIDCGTLQSMLNYFTHENPYKSFSNTGLKYKKIHTDKMTRLPKSLMSQNHFQMSLSRMCDHLSPQKTPHC